MKCSNGESENEIAKDNEKALDYISVTQKQYFVRK